MIVNPHILFLSFEHKDFRFPKDLVKGFVTKAKDSSHKGQYSDNILGHAQNRRHWGPAVSPPPWRLSPAGTRSHSVNTRGSTFHMTRIKMSLTWGTNTHTHALPFICNIYIHTHTYTYAHSHKHTHFHFDVTYINIHTHAHTHINTHFHFYVTYINTHTHMHPLT